MRQAHAIPLDEVAADRGSLSPAEGITLSSDVNRSSDNRVSDVGASMAGEDTQGVSAATDSSTIPPGPAVPGNVAGGRIIHQYVAIGDSCSAGPGASGNDIEGNDANGKDCLRTDDGWPQQFSNTLGLQPNQFQFSACTGLTQQRSHGSRLLIKDHYSRIPIKINHQIL